MINLQAVGYARLAQQPAGQQPVHSVLILQDVNLYLGDGETLAIETRRGKTTLLRYWRPPPGYGNMG